MMSRILSLLLLGFSVLRSVTGAFQSEGENDACLANNRGNIVSNPRENRLTPVTERGAGINVTLLDFTLIDKHKGWLDIQTDVYFHCKGDPGRQYIPAVKEIEVVYHFHGNETFQPIMSFHNRTSCKECGFFEKDTWSADDVIDSFTICPNDFRFSHIGTFVRAKGREYNVTLLCLDCAPHQGFYRGPGGNGYQNSDHAMTGVIIFITIFGSFVVVAGVALGIWMVLKSKEIAGEEKEKARFMEIFDEDDNLLQEDDVDAKL